MEQGLSYPHLCVIKANKQKQTNKKHTPERASKQKQTNKKHTMQHTAYYPTTISTATKTATYKAHAVKAEINKKIFLFVAILGCIVAAVNL